MNKTQHTPGPWGARKGDVLNPDRTWGIVKCLTRKTCREIDGDESGYGHRTEVVAEVTQSPTDEADARLIAAAPDLLEALQDVFYDWVTLVGEDLKEENEDVQRIWKKCENALNKAEGGAA